MTKPIKHDKNYYAQIGLSFYWSIMASAYIAAVTFLTIPSENIRIVDTIVGFLLGTIVSTVISYWFGSSLGSKMKDPDPAVRGETDESQ